MRHQTAIATVALLAVSAGAYAQSAPETPLQGPLVLEPIHSPFVVAADYKTTEIDGNIGHMAGVRAGRLVDDAFLAGAAAYWLPDGPNRTKLTYAGALFAWSSSSRRGIRFGGSALLGGGTAQLATEFTVLQRAAGSFRAGPSRAITAAPDGTRIVSVLVRDDFFVFEPQATLNTRITDHVSVDWAAGYRVIGLADTLEDRLDGATGSVALRFTF